MANGQTRRIARAGSVLDDHPHEQPRRMEHRTLPRVRQPAARDLIARPVAHDLRQSDVEPGEMHPIAEAVLTAVRSTLAAREGEPSGARTSEAAPPDDAPQRRSAQTRRTDSA